jgi:hypothetical protein
MQDVRVRTLKEEEEENRRKYSNKINDPLN